MHHDHLHHHCHHHQHHCKVHHCWFLAACQFDWMVTAWKPGFKHTIVITILTIFTAIVTVIIIADSLALAWLSVRCSPLPLPEGFVSVINTVSSSSTSSPLSLPPLIPWLWPLTSVHHSLLSSPDKSWHRYIIIVINLEFICLSVSFRCINYATTKER